jgi:hypothetical protein
MSNLIYITQAKSEAGSSISLNAVMEPFDYLNTPLSTNDFTYQSISAHPSATAAGRIATIVLETLQFFSKCPDDLLFINSFEKLQEALRWCTSCLTFPSDFGHDMPSDLDTQGISNALSTSNGGAGDEASIAVKAHAFELKLRLFTNVDHVVKLTNQAQKHQRVQRAEVKAVGRMQKPKRLPPPEGLSLKGRVIRSPF